MVIPWLFEGFWVDASWYGLSSLCMWDCSLCFSCSWDKKRMVVDGSNPLAPSKDEPCRFVHSVQSSGLSTCWRRFCSCSYMTSLISEGFCWSEVLGVGPWVTASWKQLLYVWHLPGDTWPCLENKIVMLVMCVFVLQWPNSYACPDAVLEKAHINLTTSILWAKTGAVREGGARKTQQWRCSVFWFLGDSSKYFLHNLLKFCFL